MSLCRGNREEELEDCGSSDPCYSSCRVAVPCDFFRTCFRFELYFSQPLCGHV